MFYHLKKKYDGGWHLPRLLIYIYIHRDIIFISNSFSNSLS